METASAGAASGQPEARFGIVPPWASATWDDWATESPAGHMHQFLWWAAPLSEVGVSSHVVAAWSGDELLGGTLFRGTKVPRLPARIMQSDDGPAFEGWEASYATPYANAIAELARDSRALAVIIRGCPSPAIHGDLVDALRRLQGDVVLSRAVTEAVLNLEDQTTQTLWSGFTQGARRGIKRARGKGVQVTRLDDTDGLRAAYDTWMATARRKQFESVRPWPALEPVLRRSVSSGAGVVFGALVGGSVIASIFVTYVGRAAVYFYGGYRDGAEPYSSPYLLHVAAIEEAIARGFSEYSLGSLPADGDPRGSGIDQFKLSFGALPRPGLDTITWRRHVLLYEGLTRLRENPIGARIERALRHRAIAGAWDH